MIASFDSLDTPWDGSFNQLIALIENYTIGDYDLNDYF